MKHVSILASLVLAATAAFAAPQVVFKPVPAALLAQANSEKILVYGPQYGGTYMQGQWKAGKILVQALASYAGNRDADKPLLAQLRAVLKGDAAICGNGGYSAQHERMYTTAVVMAKNTPEVWSQLTDKEKHKLDLLMKASLIGAAVTTNDKMFSDKKARKTATCMDGDTNFYRDWNPNHREGAIGGLIAGACYFGPAEAQKFLDTYDHEKFCEELKAADLENPYKIFSGQLPHKKSKGLLTPDEINNAVHGFTYYNMTLADAMKIYLSLVTNTYSGTVAAGLNDGEGIDGGGKIAAGADELPNKGKKGMLKEFASIDEGGKRSCVKYCYGGFRPDMANLLTLVTSGKFEFDNPEWKEAFALMKVGNEDLFYKLDKGYICYSHGKAETAPITYDPKRDFAMMRDLWLQTILPTLEANTK